MKIVVGCVQISGRAHAMKAGVLLASMAAVAALVLVAQVTLLFSLCLSRCLRARSWLVARAVALPAACAAHVPVEGVGGGLNTLPACTSCGRVEVAQC